MLLGRWEKDHRDECLNSFKTLAWEGEGAETDVFLCLLFAFT